MGVWNGMVVGPANGEAIGEDQFLGLASGLIDEDLVTSPFTIIQGNLETFPFSLWSYPQRGVGKYGDIQVPFHGEKVGELISTSRKLLDDDKTFAIWFNGFNLANTALSDAFSVRSYANVDVVLYSFSEPQDVNIEYFKIFEGELEKGEIIRYKVSLTQYFCPSGKSGPTDIRGTPLRPLLIKHFGDDLQVHCSSG